MPSSPTDHSPLMRIDTWNLVLRDVMHEPSGIVGMRCACLRHSVLRALGRKEFLAGNADGFAPMLCIHLSGVDLQPSIVPVELCTPLAGVSQRLWVTDLFYD